MAKADISVALATFNEAKNIDRCLASVASWVKEIVVVDGGSTDDTVALAKQFHAQVVVTDNPANFHINKQKALDLCRGTWILQLDADEVVTAALRGEILKAIQDPSFHGYYLPRKNYFAGHWLSKGGQYPDYLIRLFRRGKGSFPQKSVHEQIVVSGAVGHLSHPLEHYAYASVAEYWHKSNAYTTLTAREMQAKNVSRSIMSGGFYLFIKPIGDFFLRYIRHKGFVDGWYGFLFAFFSALHYPIAYMKYRWYPSL